MRNYVKEIKDIQIYVWEFYNEKSGIYPIANIFEMHQKVSQI